MEIDKKKVAKGVLSLASGWYMAKQAGGVFVEAGAAAKRVRDLAKVVFKRRKASRVHATFAEAVARLNLTEADLRDKEEEFQFRSALGFLSIVAGFAFFVFFPTVTHQVSHILMSAGVMLVGAASWLRWRFRACQVRDRELYAFGSWLARDEWVRRVAIAVGTVVSLALALFAVSAKAEGLSLHAFSPAPGDASVSYLREIYGSVIDQIAAGANTKNGQVDSVLGRMLVPFNTAVLFLGMIFVAYTTITGTINSAHDGEILGKRMSEIWVPIRTVGGTALLLPLANGYCLIQIGALWLSLQGVGIANQALNAFLDHVNETNMVTRPHLPDTRQLAASILKSEVCAAAMNKSYADYTPTRIVADESTWVVVNTGEVGIGDAVTTGALASVPVAGTVLALGSVARTAANVSYRVTEFHWREMLLGKPVGLNPNVCGSLTWHESEESANGNGNTMIAKRAIMLAHRDAVRQMIEDLRPLAQQIVVFHEGLKRGAIEAAAARYENALQRAAKAAVEKTSDARREEFTKAAREGGWIYISIYYNHLIQLNDITQSALNSLPSPTPITIERRETSDALITYQDAMTVADEYIKAKSEAPRQELRRQFKQDGEFPTSWGDLKRLLSGFAQVGIYELTQQLAGSNLSHVGQIKAVGDVILGSAETLATMTFIANGAANSNLAKVTMGNVFDAGSALASINPLIMTICLSLVVFGAIAAHYIPMIPFIIGITAVIKWFVAVFEAVIAAPLWAAAHIHPDGEGMAGRGGNGYMLILNVIMRPALAVFGFVGSILIAGPITGFINIGYMTSVQGAEHNSFSFIAAFVAYTIIYVIIMTGVIHSIFSLVNYLPDNVPRWIGDHTRGPDLSPEREQEHADGDFKGAIAVGTRGGHGGAPKTPGGNNIGKDSDGGGKPSQADKNRANAEHFPEPQS